MLDFTKIEEILDNVDLKENMSAAEFGCGSAAFAVGLAKRLKGGMVYAMDIQEEKLSALQGKLSLDKITNVVTMHCDLESPNGSNLSDNSLDLVLIPNLIFQKSLDEPGQ